LVKQPYVPDTGDLVWLTFDPQAGREQRGRRPALILSPRAYNQRALLAVACPITSHAKGYPFEVTVKSSRQVSGVILADHLKSVDWKERDAKFAGKVDLSTLANVRERVSLVLGL
jgi:mRNA interferase MazF